MRPWPNTASLRWLFLAVLILGAMALVTIATNSSFAGGDELQSLRSDNDRLVTSLDRSRSELAVARRRVERTQDRLRRAHIRTQHVSRRLERASRLSSERGRLLGELRDAAGGQLPLTDDACAVNLALAASRGLRAPVNYAIHCPGPGLDWSGGSHWGVTCPYEDCPEGDGPYISVSNPTYYVIAHELCHAAFGYGVGPGEEALADACAAQHGASLATSPYG